MGLENPLHIAIILMVVLLVFGAKRLPEMGKGLGEGMRGFKSALSGDSQPEPASRLQQLAAAEPAPVAATGVTAEERSPEPVA
ncbi:MAG TPA: twin-arginine translocase TatA/TatE family subunit [Solirubrobacteraceae bacterium]|nr:twin-arginine translocase TatA/TatE family subunit [Solirubrobacteraceae bacterium]